MQRLSTTPDKALQMCFMLQPCKPDEWSEASPKAGSGIQDQHKSCHWLTRRQIITAEHEADDSFERPSCRHRWSRDGICSWIKESFGFRRHQVGKHPDTSDSAVRLFCQIQSLLVCIQAAMVHDHNRGLDF
ncbi:hypothetical protein Y1Q_0005791 [Alligator mississippiensis]|uniref:Uncharacterized protein n=1 Tax=Alligator mississippiensis TaxID=8496 RepID=A0A151MGA9_ALLMI|nr:hypothetical protein Y1Q_0005791 [Alligator mississippiensis]